MIIGMDLMSKVGLIIMTPWTTYTLSSDLETLFEENKIEKNVLKQANWRTGSKNINQICPERYGTVKNQSIYLITTE